VSTRFHIKQAASLVYQGGVIAYPTESVYGLGCNPFDQQAVTRLCQLKQRPLSKGMILITDQLEKLEALLALTSAEKNRILQHTEIVTWLVNKSEYTPAWVSGNHHRVAIRITQHPIASALCRQLSIPLISTSANVSQHTPARNTTQVHCNFGIKLDKILSGRCGPLQRTTPIIDLHTGKVLRN